MRGQCTAEKRMDKSSTQRSRTMSAQNKVVGVAHTKVARFHLALRLKPF